MQMQRQAATPNGIRRRIKDLRFNEVTDTRMAGKVKHGLPTILSAFVLGIATATRSLRQVEERSAQVAQKHKGMFGLDSRIADNTFARVLQRLALPQLVACLHQQVKAEHRRGNLDPTVLGVGTIAIDGKNVATLRWHDLCRVLNLERDEATAEEVKELLTVQYPDVQFCRPEHGQPYALARVHTVTLVSSDAAMCIHQRATLGHTNEIGSMPQLLEELHAAYRKTSIFRRITTDAGNASLKVAGLIVGYGWDYFLQLKSGQGELYSEARRALGSKPEQEADFTVSDQQNGKTVTYYVWCQDLSGHGWLEWTHARQLVRIQRVALDGLTGETVCGQRYYASSEAPANLSPKALSKISRAHWRCENETHWTADAEVHEDLRRLSWSRHPAGVFAVALLRRIGVNILAVARQLSRYDYTLETPSWHQVAVHFMVVLCGTILDLSAFDADA